jgi:hypothetical protein
MFYHMVDEPFDYNMVSGVEEPVRPEKPEAIVLYENLLNPSDPYASIESRLPINGFKRLEIVDGSGTVTDVSIEGHRVRGIHMTN